MLSEPKRSWKNSAETLDGVRMNNSRIAVAHSVAMSIRAAVLAAALALGTGLVAADAAQPPAKCKVVSVTTETQAVVRSGTRDVLTRDVTTTRCRGKLTTTYSAWR